MVRSVAVAAGKGCLQIQLPAHKTTEFLKFQFPACAVWGPGGGVLSLIAGCLPVLCESPLVPATIATIAFRDASACLGS